jgi:hypothetical protein
VSGRPPNLYGPCEKPGYIHAPGKDPNGKSDRGRPECHRMEDTKQWFPPYGTRLSAPVVDFVDDATLGKLAALMKKVK